MRLAHLLPASLFVFACCASAQTTPYPPSDTEASSTVQVRAPASTVRLTEDQTRQITGAYKMSNGWRLSVNPVSTKWIEARIDREKPMRLRAVSPDRFVSRDGNVTMHFNQGEFQDDMTMSYVPEGRLAQVVVVSTSRIAQH